MFNQSHIHTQSKRLERSEIEQKLVDYLNKGKKIKLVDSAPAIAPEPDFKFNIDSDYVPHL